jgi:hypothetical protein
MFAQNKGLSIGFPVRCVSTVIQYLLHLSEFTTENAERFAAQRKAF